MPKISQNYDEILFVDKSHPNSDSLSLIPFICFVPPMLMINHSLTWIDTKGNKKLDKD